MHEISHFSLQTHYASLGRSFSTNGTKLKDLKIKFKIEAFPL